MCHLPGKPHIAVIFIASSYDQEYVQSSIQQPSYWVFIRMSNPVSEQHAETDRYQPFLKINDTKRLLSVMIGIYGENTYLINPQDCPDPWISKNRISYNLL